MSIAAELEIICSNNFYVIEELAQAAIENNCIDIIKTIVNLESAHEIHATMYKRAIEFKRLDIIKIIFEYFHIHDNYNNLVIDTCDLEMLQWFHDNGCEFNEYNFVHAIKRGNIEIVQWLYEHGCHTDDAHIKAIEYNKLDILLWLHRTVKECDTSCFDCAFLMGFTDIVRCLCELGIYDKNKYSFKKHNGKLHIIGTEKKSLII